MLALLRALTSLDLVRISAEIPLSHPCNCLLTSFQSHIVYIAMQIVRLSESQSRDSIGSFRLSSASLFPRTHPADGVQRLKALAESLPALQLHHSTKRRLETGFGLRRQKNDYISSSLLRTINGKWCPLQRSTILSSPPKPSAPSLPHYTPYRQLFPRWVKRTPPSHCLRRKVLADSDKVVIF